MNETKTAPINPMSFTNEEEAKKKNEDYKNFEKALRFGCPKLCDKLVAIYKKNGLKGLHKIESMIENIDYIIDILNNDTQWQIDFYPAYPSKEAVIGAIITGKIDLNTNPTDWEDPAEAHFPIDE